MVALSCISNISLRVKYKFLLPDNQGRLSDRGKTYFLQTDASDSGIGVVLMQKHDDKLFPVCYASKKFATQVRNFGTRHFPTKLYTYVKIT